MQKKFNIAYICKINNIKHIQKLILDFIEYSLNNSFIQVITLKFELLFLFVFSFCFCWLSKLNLYFSLQSHIDRVFSSITDIFLILQLLSQN